MPIAPPDQQEKKLEEQVERDLPNNSPEKVAIQMESKLEELLTRDCPETEAEPGSPIDEEIEEDSAATSLQDLITLINEINDEIKNAKLHVMMHTVQREEVKNTLPRLKLITKRTKHWLRV